jgi:hypothetical protein
MTARKQARTGSVTIHRIVGHPEFERGLEEARRGCPLNPDIDHWFYEWGRQFAFVAPLDMQLRVGARLNPKALKLAEAAFRRKLFI